MRFPSSTLERGSAEPGRWPIYILTEEYCHTEVCRETLTYKMGTFTHPHIFSTSPLLKLTFCQPCILLTSHPLNLTCTQPHIVSTSRPLTPHLLNLVFSGPQSHSTSHRFKPHIHFRVRETR